ncbi:MAG: hypothetical protein AAGI46_09050 [Planctomycetota bacterium]
MLQRLLRRLGLPAIAAVGVAIATMPTWAQPAGRGQTSNVPLLTEEQINLVRQAELQPLDGQSRGPRIRFDENLIRRFVDARPELDFRAFNTGGDVAKALFILENGTEEEQADVLILTDPASLELFKRSIHTAVIRGCATSACHGSNDPERHAGFQLVNSGRGDDVIYTNFYTLSRGKVSVANPTGGAFGGPAEVERRLIERQNPEASLLLTYALPAGATDRPHPEVEGYRPLFQNPREPVYRDLTVWLNEVLDRTVVGYAFDEDAATQTPADSAP